MTKDRDGMYVFTMDNLIRMATDQKNQAEQSEAPVVPMMLVFGTMKGKKRRDKWTTEPGVHVVPLIYGFQSLADVVEAMRQEVLWITEVALVAQVQLRQYADGEWPDEMAIHEDDVHVRNAMQMTIIRRDGSREFAWIPFRFGDRGELIFDEPEGGDTMEAGGFVFKQMERLLS